MDKNSEIKNCQHFPPFFRRHFPAMILVAFFLWESNQTLLLLFFTSLTNWNHLFSVEDLWGCQLPVCFIFSHITDNKNSPKTVERQVSATSSEVRAVFFPGADERRWARGGTPDLLFSGASRSTDNFMIAIWFHGEKNIKQDPYTIMQCLLCFISSQTGLHLLVYLKAKCQRKAHKSHFLWTRMVKGSGHLIHMQMRPQWGITLPCEFWAEPWLQLWMRTSHKDFGDNNRELKSWAWFVHNLYILMRQWLSIWLFNLMDTEGSFWGSWLPSSFIVGTT